VEANAVPDPKRRQFTALDEAVNGCATEPHSVGLVVDDAIVVVENVESISLRPPLGVARLAEGLRRDLVVAAG